ncbi:MAG TPA: hypothetical protein VGF95_06700 [Solirubrobacteraceae bacterium]|jgi:hypothetical protein
MADTKDMQGASGRSTAQLEVAGLQALAVIPVSLRALHETVVGRALAAEAQALILTGSTAREARTPVSDLDYHLIGTPIETDDLPGELDVHVLSPANLRARLREGDDFVHWSLRLGRVVFDQGIVRETTRLIREQRLWPDATRKLTQARKSVSLAHAMVASEDEDAALEQACTALTLTARWQLLEQRVFPLSRAELPAQLRESGHTLLATGLDATIRRAASLQDLTGYLNAAEALTESTQEPRHLSNSRAA